MNEQNPNVSDVDPVAPDGDSAPDETSGEPNGTKSDQSEMVAGDPNGEPIIAVLADGEVDEAIREGSPFAIDPEPKEVPRSFEPLLDVGPLKYTAMGAVAAAAMVLLFAIVAAWWFPAGGALIAALGCVLSIFGLYSHYRLASGALLAMHLGLFVYSYGQTLT